MLVRPHVCVVDDDESVRESLPDFLRELGFDVQAFASATEFLKSDCLGRCECLILDIAMPFMTGPDLQRELSRRVYDIPIIFITAQFDEKVRSQVMAQGAVTCLLKPFDENVLLDALKTAIPPK